MKKTFKLTDPKKTFERQVDWVKHEIKKYVVRERRKPLPEHVDYWDFDCMIGENETNPTAIKLSEINRSIDKITANKKTSFYLEIHVKAGLKQKKTASPGEVNLQK